VTTLVTGATSGLGRRVLARLDGVQTEPVPGHGELVVPADTMLHLATGDHDALANLRANAVRLTQQVLDAADAAGVVHIVLVSSAMVYGAWPNNPVPLTEGAPLRPDLGFGFAQQLAQVERLVDEWRLASPDRSVAVLRPALSLAADGTSSVVRALAAGMGSRLDEDDPPAQFLHLDDLASAVVLALRDRLDGVFNVAPDGWVPGETVRALAGTPPRVRLPSWLVERIADVRWRFQRGPIPPGLRPYARHPWLVANDRLRAVGWVPGITNEQAYVEGTEAKWWTMLTPKRKQELALVSMIGAAMAATLSGWTIIRRARHRFRG
jgi:nucleoside-diphosphate-sugar epimerase